MPITGQTALSTINIAKEQVITFQPLLLAQLTLVNGTNIYLSTENLAASLGGVQYSGNDYLPRIMNQSIGALQAVSDNGIVQSPQLTLELADADGYFWNTYELTTGFKGAKLQLIFVFWDPGTSTFSSDYQVKFVGVCNAPQEVNARSLTLMFSNILNLTNTNFPLSQVARTCPRSFPATAAQRAAALNNIDSEFYGCGYSPDQSGGVGNNVLSGSPCTPATGGSVPYTTCSLSFADCVNRLGNPGAATLSKTYATPVTIEKDLSGHVTGRFAGTDWDPPLSWGGNSYLSGTKTVGTNNPNDAKINGYYPMIFGTTFISPPPMNVVGDPNYTWMEVVICEGQLTSALDQQGQVQMVMVNDYIIPFSGGHPVASSMWWDWVSTGNRNGQVNRLPIYDGTGDPYGGLATIVICVPNQVAQTSSIPSVRVLTGGPAVRVWASTDVTDYTLQFTQNPVWNLAALLTAGPYQVNTTKCDLDLASWIAAAAVCTPNVNYIDMLGNPEVHPRYQLGVALLQRQVGADIVKNWLAGFKGMLAPNAGIDPALTGKLQLFIKQTLADQQPAPVTGSNNSTPFTSAHGADTLTPTGSPLYIPSSITTANGYSAYSFSESNILTQTEDRGSPSTFKIQQRPIADTPNQLGIALQDEDYSYTPDTVALIDSADVGRATQRVVGSVVADGIVNIDQAKRAIECQMAEQFRGNPRYTTDLTTLTQIDDTGGTWIAEFECSFRAVHLRVGHLIDISYAKYGLTSQLFRVLSLSPSMNMERITVRAQWHQDDWYLDSYGQAPDPILKVKGLQDLNRGPFAWHPNSIAPMANDALYSSTDKEMSIGLTFGVDQNGNASRVLNISGAVPVNQFSSEVQPPYAPQATVAASGGSLKIGTYYVALCSIDSSGFMSPPSGPVASAVCTTNISVITLPNIYWGAHVTAWKLYAGTDPNSLTLQTSGSGTPSSVSFSTYVQNGEGIPDTQFDHFTLRAKNIAYGGGGTYGFSVIAVPSASVVKFSLTDIFPTNFWVGRVLTIAAYGRSALPLVQNDYVISASDGKTLTLHDSTGGAAALTSIPGFGVGSVCYIRAQADTFTETTIGDSKFVNAASTLTFPCPIINATNASPIVLTVQSGIFAFVTGATVDVSNVEGNTAANGTWVISAASSGDLTNTLVTLVGSTGNGTFSGASGVVQEHSSGLSAVDYRGKIVRILAGTGRGQRRSILSNTSTVLTVDSAFQVVPDATSIFIIEEPHWALEVSTSSLQNADPTTAVQLFALDVSALQRFSVGDGLVLQVFCENSDESKQSLSYNSPVRDIWVPATPAAAVSGAPDVASNVVITGIEQAYDSNQQLVVKISYNAPAVLGTFTGVHVYAEIPDQSQGVPVVIGTTPADSSTVMGGQWKPLDYGKFAFGPAALAGGAAGVVTFPIQQPIPFPELSRFYLSSITPFAENTLVQASPAGLGTTPSTTIALAAPSQPAGTEYAQLVTGFTPVTVAGSSVPGIEFTNENGTPKFRIRLAWTDPTQGQSPWMIYPYKGVQLWTQWADMPLFAGTAWYTPGVPQWTVEVNAGVQQFTSQWYPLAQQHYNLKMFAASIDTGLDQNTIVPGLTPSVQMIWDWPLAAAPASAKLAPLPTGFSLAASYTLNAQGVKVLQHVLTWVNPTNTATTGYGGSEVSLAVNPGSPPYGASVVASLTMAQSVTLQFTNFPSTRQTWVYWLTSADPNSNPNTDPTNPVAGTPSITTFVDPPPSGAVGTEQTGVVTNTVVTNTQTVDNNGVTSNSIVATATPPQLGGVQDPSFGGVGLEIRDQSSGTLIGVYDGGVQLAVVSTAGTAVTWGAGITFDASMVGLTVEINNTPYVIASVASSTSLTLSTSAGTQSLVTLTFIKITIVLPEPTGGSRNWVWALRSYDGFCQWNSFQIGVTPYGVLTNPGSSTGLDGAAVRSATVKSSALSAATVGGSGVEYAASVTSASAAVTTPTSSDGTNMKQVTATFTPPAGTTIWAAVELRVYDGSSVLVGKVRSATSPCSVLVQNPTTVQTYTWKLVSIDVNGRPNTETGGTPQGTLSLGTTAATLNGQKIVAGSIDTISLNATSISVGGGGSKPGFIDVFDASAASIGFIGTRTYTSVVYSGAWFKQLRVGGTAPVNAPFQVDSSGNVIIDNSSSGGLTATFKLVANSITSSVNNAYDSSISQYMGFSCADGFNNRSGLTYGGLYSMNAANHWQFQLYGGVGGLLNLYDNSNNQTVSVSGPGSSLSLLNGLAQVYLNTLSTGGQLRLIDSSNVTRVDAGISGGLGYLKFDNAVSIGGAAFDSWTAYTPTITATGFTATASVKTMRWVKIGRTVVCRFKVVYVASGVGAGPYSLDMTLPTVPGAALDADQAFSAYLYWNTGSGATTAVNGLFKSTTVASVGHIAFNSGDTYTDWGTIIYEV